MADESYVEIEHLVHITYIHQCFTTLYLCTCEIRSKKGSERAVPNIFQQPDMFWKHKKMSENAQPRNQVQNSVRIKHEIRTLIRTQVRTGMLLAPAGSQ